MLVGCRPIRYFGRRSARAGIVQELADDLDLIRRDQRWRMTAILNSVDAHVAIPTLHILENSFGEQIGLLSADHQDGNIDGIPVFPEVHAVMPGVSKGVGNIRIAKRLEAASLRAPCNTVRRQMPPVRILQPAERSQNPTVVALGLLDHLEGLWR